MKVKEDKSTINVLYNLKSTTVDTGYTLEFNRLSISRKSSYVNQVELGLYDKSGKKLFLYNITKQPINNFREGLEITAQKALETGHVMVMSKWSPYIYETTGLPMAKYPCIHTVMRNGEVIFCVCMNKDEEYRFKFPIEDVYNVCKEVTVDEWS